MIADAMNNFSIKDTTRLTPFQIYNYLLAASSYYVLKRDVDREVYENARVFLFTMESIRKHYGDVTRPAVSKELPEKFIVEAMSTSFNARGVAERVRKEFPQYIFKHASLNPRNPINKADKFEEEIISKFRANKTLKESNGFVKKESGEYFYVSRPVTTRRIVSGAMGPLQMLPWR